MTLLCCMDLDGVVVNRDAHLALARGVYIARCKEEGKEPEPQTYNHGFDWDTFQDSAHVPLDTLIEGAYEAIHALRNQGWRLVYLTSRPESMRWATLTWLSNQGIACQPVDGALRWIDVYMKDEEARYDKTPQWKAQQVMRLVEMYQASEILIVDDQISNLEAIVQVLTVPFRVHTSLNDAVNASQDQAMRYLAGER
jgi:hypothetical protein